MGRVGDFIHATPDFRMFRGHIAPFADDVRLVVKLKFASFTIDIVPHRLPLTGSHGLMAVGRIFPIEIVVFRLIPGFEQRPINVATKSA